MSLRHRLFLIAEQVFQFSRSTMMAETMDVEKVEKLRNFVAKTGLEEHKAVQFLQEEKWNVESALAKFSFIKTAEEKRKEGNQLDGRPMSANSNRVGLLRRGLSMANQELVANVRQQIDSCERSQTMYQFEHFEESPSYTFMLPDITKFKDKKLVEFLKTDLIDKSIYLSLTKAGVLNWWADGFCRKLFPMSTIGDGNCLLHAVSLGMWGFHDRLLTLRKALHESLDRSLGDGSLKRRWMYQQWTLNMKAGGLCFTKEEWNSEWKEIIRLASDKPRTPNISPTRKISRTYSIATSPGKSSSTPQSPDNFESLEEFHVFALAHVLRRPIIVIADTMLRDIDGVPVQPINFGGIYLPIECDPAQCYKYPLILGYDAAHFAALVPADGEDIGQDKLQLSSSVPLCRIDFELLPIQFVTDPGGQWTFTEHDAERTELPELSRCERLKMLSKYLNLVKVNNVNRPKTASIDAKVNKVVELDVKPNEFDDVHMKKEKKGKGEKSTVIKALENISTLMTGQVNAARILSRSNSNDFVYAAKLDLINRPRYFGEMINNYIETTKQRLETRTETKCMTPGCNFYGTEDTNFLCSSCFRYQKDMSIKQKSTLLTLKEQSGNADNVRNPTSPTAKIGANEEPVSSHQSKDLNKHPTENLLIDFTEPVVPRNVAEFDFDPITKPLNRREESFHPDLYNLPHSRRSQPTAPYQNLDPVSSFQEKNARPLVNETLPERLPHFEPMQNASAPPITLVKIEKGGNIPAAGNPVNQFTSRRLQFEANLSRVQNDDAGLSSEIPPARLPEKQSKEALYNPLCKRNGCKFYGTQALDGFCSSCFARQYNKTGYV